MKEIDLRALQLIEFEAFKEIDRICKKHNIMYFMCYGTLIGAVRHKGFIPWDCDMDIVMMRKDYDKFAEVCSSELSHKYFLQNYHTDPGFLPALTRICINGTYLYDKYTEHLKFHKGAYIDIFPLDNSPDNEKLRKKHERNLLLIDILIFYKSCIIYSNGTLFLKEIGKKVLKFIMYPIPLKLLQNLRVKVMKEYNSKSTLNVCSTVGKYGYKKEIMDKKIFETPALLEFEGEKYHAPGKWDLCLRKLYGDYMIPPPEKERKPEFVVYEI